MVLALAPRGCAREEAVERSWSAGGAAKVLLFHSEADLLLTWMRLLRAFDPDVLALFQVRGEGGGGGGAPPPPRVSRRGWQAGWVAQHCPARGSPQWRSLAPPPSLALAPPRQVRETLEVLVERFAALRLEGGGMHLSRLKQAHRCGGCGRGGARQAGRACTAARLLLLLLTALHIAAAAAAPCTPAQQAVRGAQDHNVFG